MVGWWWWDRDGGMVHGASGTVMVGWCQWDRGCGMMMWDGGGWTGGRGMVMVGWFMVPLGQGWWDGASRTGMVTVPMGQG